MSKSRIVFFPDPLNNDTDHFMKELKQQFLCCKSSNADEFDQVYKQSGKFVIVFSSVTFALKFIEKNAIPLAKLQFKSFCFLRDNEHLDKEDQALLRTYQVCLFQNNKFKEIKNIISLFFEDLVFEN